MSLGLRLHCGFEGPAVIRIYFENFHLITFEISDRVKENRCPLGSRHRVFTLGQDESAFALEGVESLLLAFLVISPLAFDDVLPVLSA